MAKANAAVSIRYANHEVVRTTTDENGVFAAKGLRGGQYELLTDDGVSACRLWAADTAPPAARPAALLVSGDNVVRGQGAVTQLGCLDESPSVSHGRHGCDGRCRPAGFGSDDDDDRGS